jgi:hypothetical protein
MCTMMFYEMASSFAQCNHAAFLDVIACMLHYFNLNRDELMVFTHNSINCFKSSNLQDIVYDDIETVIIEIGKEKLPVELIDTIIKNVIRI